VREARAFVMIRLDAALPKVEAIGGKSAVADFKSFASSAVRTAFNLVFNSERIVRLRCVLAAICRMRLAVDGRFTLPLLAVAPGGGPPREATFYHRARRRVKWSHAERSPRPHNPPAGWNPDPSRSPGHRKHRLPVPAAAGVDFQ